MTAPDPLVCINTRAAGAAPTCEPNRGHCVRCQMCKHACTCRQLTELDKTMLATALDAYSQHAGGTDWETFTNRVPQHVADNAFECVLAGAEPLLAEIRRLTNERAGLAVDLDTEIEDAPAPCFTEDDYAAGFIAGLDRALQLVRGQDQTAEVDNLKHSKETS